MLTKLFYDYYKRLFLLLPKHQILQKLYYGLLGLEKCIQQGPNLDLFPHHSLKNEKYYEWYYSKKYTTLFFNSENILDISNFQELCQLEYVKQVHHHLLKLNLFPFCSKCSKCSNLKNDLRIR